MSGGSIRNPETDDEIRAYLAGMRTAFLSGKDVTDEMVTWSRKHWDFSRIWAAVDDDGTQCGTTRTFPSGLRLPGLAEVPVSCLTQVTVLPTHTRRGHVTRLMRTQLEHAIEVGEVASLLVAAEWPIYGRFGYGQATTWSQWEIDTQQARFHPSVPGPTGRCELVSPDEYVSALEDVHLRHQALTVGSIRRLPYMFPLDAGVELRPGDEKKEARVRVLHRDAAGRPDGFAVYDPEEKWDGMRPRCVVKVEDMAWTSAEGERELWRYLLDIDLVAQVKYDGSSHIGLRHLLVNGRDANRAGHWDHIWAVVLDVPAALEARAYTSGGTFVLEVLDPFLGRGGRFTLDASPEGTSVRSTPDATPDITLPLAALSGPWLGGTDLRHVARQGTVDEHRPGAVAELAAVLRWHEEPDCFTDF